MCKIKSGNYSYIGFVRKEIVSETRKVRMTGNTDMDGAGDEIRRIFAEQYTNLSDLIKIFVVEEEQEEKIIKQKFVPLHVHSGFSIGDAYGKPEYIAEQAKKRGFDGCALTDHGTLAGLLTFERAMKEKEIKPILGCEFYIVDGDHKSKNEKRHHVTVIFKNEEGWRNGLKLHEIAVREGFYYKPRISIEQLLKYSGGLIVFSGCSSGLINVSLKNNDFEKAEKYFKLFKETFGEDFYAEFILHKAVDNQNTLKKLLVLSEKYNAKRVLTTDSHYTIKEEKEVHDALKAISLKKKYGEAGFGDDCFYLMQDLDLFERAKADFDYLLPHIQEMIDNTREIFEKIDLKIPVLKDENETLPEIIVDRYRKTGFGELVNEFEEWKNNKENLVLTNHPEVSDE